MGRVEMDERLLPVGIPARILNELRTHARETYDEECCGLVLSEAGLRYGRAVRCQNEMTKRQREDPHEFPGRDNRSGYYMNTGDVLAVAREAERTGAVVTAVYHSHVGASAYLSQVDLSYAQHALYPFPHADQIVLSVIEGRVSEIKIFVRSGDAFTEHSVREEVS